MTRLGRRSVKLVIVAALVVSGVTKAGNALSAPKINYKGGAMKNFVVDIIFAGPFTGDEHANVLNTVKNVTDFINGSSLNPPGFEPAVHFYNVWGAVPGNWVDAGDLFAGSGVLWGGAGELVNENFADIASNAHQGVYGASSNIVGSAQVLTSVLPAGPNRLAMVITKGTNIYADTDSQNLGSHPEQAIGLHSTSGAPYPYGAAMYDPGGPGTTGLSTILSEEIMEAMTDPVVGDTWLTDEGFGGFYHHEIADDCSSSSVTGQHDIALNPAYGGVNNIAAGSCRATEPEQYAPIAATVEFTGFAPQDNRCAPGFLCVYVTFRRPNGHLGQIEWLAAPSGAPLAHTTPVDLGQPSIGSQGNPTPVTARGKPSVVFGYYTGEYIFVRGSDNALWSLHEGTWTWLGGQLFGDPSAVSWNGGHNINIFALGTDDHIYNYGIQDNSSFTWQAIPNNADKTFSSPPKAFSRSDGIVELFAVDEGGSLQWIPYSTTNGWSAAGNLGGFNGPNHSPPGISSWGINRLDIIAGGDASVGHKAYIGGSGWTSWDGAVIGTSPSGSPAAVSWAENRIDTFLIDRNNGLQHMYYDGAWHPDVGNPMATDAVGDPVVVSRGPGQLDVFYRTAHGSLSHLNFYHGWSVQADILVQDAIQ